MELINRFDNCFIKINNNDNNSAPIGSTYDPQNINFFF